MSKPSEYTPEESIERYCLGQMDPVERGLFEEQLTQDNELKILLEELRPAILSLQLSDMKQTLTEIHQVATVSSAPPQTYLYMAMAASFSLLVWSLGLFFSMSNERLFDTYFKTYPDVMTLRSSDNAAPTANCLTLYTKGDYLAAITCFEAISDLSADYEFYLALSYLANGQDKMAVQIFETNSFQESKFGTHANWYLALAYLSVGNKIECERLLTVLIETNSSYSKQASELLRKMK